MDKIRTRKMLTDSECQDVAYPIAVAAEQRFRAAAGICLGHGEILRFVNSLNVFRLSSTRVPSYSKAFWASLSAGVEDVTIIIRSMWLPGLRRSFGDCLRPNTLG